MTSAFRLTPRAAADLDAIADYTIETHYRIGKINTGQSTGGTKRSIETEQPRIDLDLQEHDPGDPAVDVFGVVHHLHCFARQVGQV